MPSFIEKTHTVWSQGKLLCAGLDLELSRVPVGIAPPSSRWTCDQVEFARRFIGAISDVAGFLKPNDAFYTAAEDEAHASLSLDGERTLRQIFEYVGSEYPHLVSIYDAKRADIGATNVGYARKAFDLLGADALTVNPYFGLEATKPFLDYGDKGIIILCHTSNKGGGEFQDRLTEITPAEAEAWGYADGQRESVTFVKSGRRYYFIPLYQIVAHRVVTEWNYNGNCALVMGATFPEQLAIVRSIVGDGFPLLLPGLGKQGADLDATVASGIDSQGVGIMVNNSSQLDFAYQNSAEHDETNFELASRAVAIQNDADLRGAVDIAMAT